MHDVLFLNGNWGYPFWIRSFYFELAAFSKILFMNKKKTLLIYGISCWVILILRIPRILRILRTTLVHRCTTLTRIFGHQSQTCRPGGTSSYYSFWVRFCIWILAGIILTHCFFSSVRSGAGVGVLNGLLYRWLKVIRMSSRSFGR